MELEERLTWIVCGIALCSSSIKALTLTVVPFGNIFGAFLYAVLVLTMFFASLGGLILTFEEANP